MIDNEMLDSFKEYCCMAATENNTDKPPKKDVIYLPKSTPVLRPIRRNCATNLDTVMDLTPIIETRQTKEQELKELKDDITKMRKLLKRNTKIDDTCLLDPIVDEHNYRYLDSNLILDIFYGIQKRLAQMSIDMHKQ